MSEILQYFSTERVLRVFFQHTNPLGAHPTTDQPNWRRRCGRTLSYFERVSYFIAWVKRKFENLDISRVQVNSIKPRGIGGECASIRSFINLTSEGQVNTIRADHAMLQQLLLPRNPSLSTKLQHLSYSSVCSTLSEKWNI